MKTINLEQILKRHIGEYSKSPISPLVIEAMREACNKVIDLCAERAEIYYDVGGYTFVDVNSILKIKDEIG